MPTLEDIKAAFEPIADKVEFKVGQDGVLVCKKKGAWIEDADFGYYTDDVVPGLGGRYDGIRYGWLIPFDSAAREEEDSDRRLEEDAGRREAADENLAERSRNEVPLDKLPPSTFRNFAGKSPEKASDEVIVQLDPQRIHANKYNPNEMSDEDFAALLENMKKEKISPIEVRPLENGHYEVIDGEHRLRASKRLNWKLIPCIVRGVTEDRAAEINYAKNRLRGSINPWKEAELFNVFWTKLVRQEDVAAKFGVTRQYIEERLSFLKIPDEVKTILNATRVASPSLIRVITRLEDPADQEKLAKKIANGITVREAEDFVSKLKEKEVTTKTPVESPPPPLAPLAGAGIVVSTKPEESKAVVSVSSAESPKEKADAINKGGDDYVKAELRRALGQPPAGAQTVGSHLGIEKGTDLAIGKALGKTEVSGKEWWARYVKVLPESIAQDVDEHCNIGGPERKERYLKAYLSRLRLLAVTTNTRLEMFKEVEKQINSEESQGAQP